MPFSPKTLEEKPYNLCLNCIQIGKNCDGPNFLAMDTERWCEWCHLRKDYLGWTNAHVAELAGISKVSIDRVMSGNVKDLRISTMQAITKALVNGTWGKHPCAGFSEPETVYVDNPAIVEQCKKLQEEIGTVRMTEQRKVDFLKEQITVKDNLIAEYNEFIKRKNRVIRWLSILLGIAVVAIIAALVVDALNPDKGFFWLDAAFWGQSTNILTKGWF